MSEYFDLSRRRFLRHSGVAGALVLGTWLAPSPRPLFAEKAATGSAASEEANLFVALQADGRVEISCHRSEMGQQIRTAFVQIIADELEADWDQVSVRQADGDSRFGDQNTDGSRSIRTNLQRLRLAGATARTLLEQAAAAHWDVAPDTVRAQHHHVIHESGRQLPYRALTSLVGGVTPPPADQVKLKARSAWRYINRGLAAVDLQDIITGRAVYGADVRIPDTVIAVIARPPVLLARVSSYDARTARAVPGVIDIIQLPSPKPPLGFQALGGVAVLAETTWAAMEGRRKLTVQWSDSPHQAYDSDSFRRELDAQLTQPGDVRRRVGNVDDGLAAAAKTLSADYHVPHLAQAPMEPPTATARFDRDTVEIWSSTQNPQMDQAEVARLLKIDESLVTVHVTLLGGAFGRKSKPDFAAEAAWLARASRRTVRVQWTREDDIQHGFFHAVSAQHLDAGLDQQGRLIALRHRSVFPTIFSLFKTGAQKPRSEIDLGLIDNPVSAPNLQIETGRVDAHLRIGWMRSVANIYHAFALQSFLAELAHAAGRDHREFLLEAIGPDRHIDFEAEGTSYGNYGASITDYPLDTARLKHVLNRAAELAGWGRKLPPGRGLGLGVHRSFLSYVATVVEVQIDEDGGLNIPSAWVAIDAGTVINTDTVRNQLQGASVYSLSYALSSAITVSDGRVMQSNFHDYRIARIDQAPPLIEVEIIASDAPPAGVGEPGTPPFAAALCNAIFAASGQRIRELPIGDQLGKS